MTNHEAAEVLARMHLKQSRLLREVPLKRSLERPERLRWVGEVKRDLEALELAYLIITGERMWKPEDRLARVANDR